MLLNLRYDVKLSNFFLKIDRKSGVSRKQRESEKIPTSIRHFADEEEF